MQTTHSRLSDDDKAYLYKTYFGEAQIESSEMEQLPNLLEGIDTFIDVGASFGMYTYHANKILTGAEIYALEADSDRFAELKNNCEKWRAGSTNTIHPMLVAAGDSDEEVKFFSTGTHISGTVFQIPERADAFHEDSVKQVRLDRFFDDSRRYLIKIDVEGAEFRVLSGATKLLDSGRASFIIGIHSWGDRERGKTPLSVIAFMFKHRMAVSRTSTSMTANYIFSPSTKSVLGLFAEYAPHVPVLLARHVYRLVTPRFIGRKVEQWFGRRRRQRIQRHDQ